MFRFLTLMLSIDLSCSVFLFGGFPVWCSDLFDDRFCSFLLVFLVLMFNQKFSFNVCNLINRNFLQSNSTCRKTQILNKPMTNRKFYHLLFSQVFTLIYKIVDQVTDIAKICEHKAIKCYWKQEKTYKKLMDK